MQFATESWIGGQSGCIVEDSTTNLRGAMESMRWCRGESQPPPPSPCLGRVEQFTRGGCVCDLGWNTLRGGGELQASLGSVLCFGRAPSFAVLGSLFRFAGGYVLRLCTRASGSRPTVLFNMCRAEKRNRVGPPPTGAGFLDSLLAWTQTLQFVGRFTTEFLW